MATKTTKTVRREAKPRNRLRNAGVGYTSAMVAMLVILVMTLLAAPRSAPPAIAEIAPQAVEQIKESPPEQATDYGSGEGVGDGEGEGDGGGGGGGGDTSTDGSSEDDETVPSRRRCVGNPPRQIEDPQSPPCVAFWQGDNGGSTYQGVTKDTILVAAPGGGGTFTQTIADFFNRRFEFYGRKIKIVDTSGDYAPDPRDRGQGPGPERQRQAAVNADQTHQVFASLAPGSAAVEYTIELATRKVPVVSNRPTFSTAMLQQYSPYVWQYTMAYDRVFASMGEWVCHRLVPGKARHAGTDDLRRQERKFALVTYSESSLLPSDPAPIVQELRACGVEVAFSSEVATSPETSGVWAQTTVNQMQEEDVTSVICLCNAAPWGLLAKASSANNYYPEWLVSSFVLNEYNFFARLQVPPEQLANAFGIAQTPRQLYFPREPAAWAAQEQLPGYDPSTTQSSNAWAINIAIYRPLLLLASGIQMAGPTLNPETMARGLHQARFPNPDHPNRPGKVGFNGGSYAMTIDSTEIWWSNEVQGPQYDDAGAWCYVDVGERRRTGTWKRGDHVFFLPPEQCVSGRSE